MENRDILGQIKPNHPKPVESSKWGSIGLIVFAATIVFFVANMIFGDHRATFLYPDGRTVQSRGDFNKRGNGIGSHTYYNRDGTKSYEMIYDNDGKLDGEYLNWNANGQLIGSQTYFHGLKNGESKKWNDSGELIRHEIYKKDSLIQKVK